VLGCHLVILHLVMLKKHERVLDEEYLAEGYKERDDNDYSSS
jgi:hypothetical protein